MRSDRVLVNRADVEGKIEFEEQGPELSRGTLELVGGAAMTRTTFNDDTNVLTIDHVVDAMRSLAANQRKLEKAIADDDPLVLLLPAKHPYWTAPDDEREAMLVVIMGQAYGRRVNIIPQPELPAGAAPIFYSIDRAKLDREFRMPLGGMPYEKIDRSEIDKAWADADARASGYGSSDDPAYLAMKADEKRQLLGAGPAWRPEFGEIVSGWALPRRGDVEDLSDRINRATAWAVANGPLNDVEKTALGELIAAHVKALEDEGDGGISDDC